MMKHERKSSRCTITKTFRMNLFFVAIVIRYRTYWMYWLWTNEKKKVTIESPRKPSVNNDGKLERILKCRSFWCRRQIVYHENCEKENGVTKSGENNRFLGLLNCDVDFVVVVDIFSKKFEIEAMDSFLLLISFK